MSWKQSSSNNTTFLASCTNNDGSYMYASDNSNNFYMSQDRGYTWGNTYSATSNIIKICCNQSGSNVFMLDSSYNIYLSSDWGSTFSSISPGLNFIDIAMTNDTTPLLFGIYLNGPAYQSTTGNSWSLFVAESAGPFESISCGSSVTNNTGNIYLNGSNNKIYYSNNLGTSNMSPYPSKPLQTSISCGKVICAANNSNIVMTIFNNIISYSTNGGISYSSNTLTNNITDITCSYDGNVVSIVDTSGNIYQSTTGPGGTFIIQTGYPSGIIWNNISGNSNLVSMVAMPQNNTIYYYDDTQVYNYNATILDIFGGTINLLLSLTTNASGNGALIISVTGTIQYIGTTTVTPGIVTNIIILLEGTYNGNDNILNNILTSPYFTTNGFAFRDNPNSIDYLINNPSGTDIVTNNFESGNFNFTSEVLFLACLLKGTKILVKDKKEIFDNTPNKEYFNNKSISNETSITNTEYFNNKSISDEKGVYELRENLDKEEVFDEKSISNTIINTKEVSDEKGVYKLREYFNNKNISDEKSITNAENLDKEEVFDEKSITNTEYFNNTNIPDEKGVYELIENLNNKNISDEKSITNAENLNKEEVFDEKSISNKEYFNNKNFSDEKSITNAENLDKEEVFNEKSITNTIINTKEISNGKGVYKLIENLNRNDIIISEGKEYKIESILTSTFSKIEDYPYLIPKGTEINEYICNEDLYLSRGHCIKISEGVFVYPKMLESLKILQVTSLEKREKIYYHIKLHFEKGEDRRSNTITANGIVVESYSSS